ncbi:MAG: type I restriction enzyme HsdR N-terminal domain-containing protein [Nitrospira sp.]|nr:type I restriction enzyme HsdR N-terminal domain-containing protein [Nitrospira sp.]
MEDREKLIKEKLKEEEFIDMMQLRGINQTIWEMLIKEKGFNPEEIEINPEFRLQLSDCEANVSVDFIINISSVSFMVIRSVSTAIESWERYIIAFARAVKDYQIPYAVVTDGENFKIYDVLSGSLLSESLQGLFNRQEALNLIKDFQQIPCPANRQEKEKRIVYAFEGIKCPTNKE